MFVVHLLVYFLICTKKVVANIYSVIEMHLSPSRHALHVATDCTTITCHKFSQISFQMLAFLTLTI